jgi:hypothetical protein
MRCCMAGFSRPVGHIVGLTLLVCEQLIHRAGTGRNHWPKLLSVDPLGHIGASVANEMRYVLDPDTGAREQGNETVPQLARRPLRRIQTGGAGHLADTASRVLVVRSSPERWRRRWRRSRRSPPGRARGPPPPSPFGTWRRAHPTGVRRPGWGRRLRR